jgi:hypothetical protein
LDRLGGFLRRCRGVKKACGPPMVSNCGGGQCSPEVVLGEIPANERAGFAGEGLGSFQVMRRSCCGAQLGRGCSGAMARQRRRGAGVADQTGGGTEGVSGSARLRVRVPGGRGNPFVGRRGSLGVRAQGGGSPEISGGRRAGRRKERRGKALPCGPWLAERERERGGERRLAWASGLLGCGERRERGVRDGPSGKKRPAQEGGGGKRAGRARRWWFRLLSLLFFLSLFYFFPNF